MVLFGWLVRLGLFCGVELGECGEHGVPFGFEVVVGVAETAVEWVVWVAGLSLLQEAALAGAEVAEGSVEAVAFCLALLGEVIVEGVDVGGE
ncbi:hypothetical protein [Sciscionella marina]|uniref:hypothetical protein n=1 Tax=Sciscionella marina TaxID=508770 RepID=UPI000477B433|nr:hypothetical protein [Sciscionella marina]